MGALAGRKALVKVTGTATAFTDEPTTDAGAHTVYTITNAAKSVWDATATVTVKVNGSTVGATTYTLNRLAGTITFGTPNLGTDVVTVSGQYLPMSTAAGCKMFSYAESASLDDASQFGDTYKTSTRGLLDVSGSLGAWWQTGATHYFRTALVSDTPVVLEFWGDSATAWSVRIRATLNKDQIQAAVQGNIDETVDFQGLTDADGVAVAVQ